MYSKVLYLRNYVIDLESRYDRELRYRRVVGFFRCMGKSYLGFLLVIIFFSGDRKDSLFRFA